MKKLIILLSVITFISPIYAQEEIVFTGIPIIKINEGGISRNPEKLSGTKANEFKCTITKMDDKYLWATRENVELVPITSGAYTTFLASNGAGYVRVINPKMKEIVSLIDETGKNFDYVEHLLLGLKTITYYGISQ